MSKPEENKEIKTIDIEALRRLLLKPKKSETTDSLKKYWVMLLKYRYWFIASILACLVGAFVYLHYATTVYLVTSKVLIKDKDESKISTAKAKLAESLVGQTNTSFGFDNEIEVLKSIDLCRETVRDLNLNTRYFLKGRISNKEVYEKYSPYIVGFNPIVMDSVRNDIKIKFEPVGSATKITAEYADLAKNSKTVKSFPVQIKLPVGKIKIQKNPLYEDSEFELKEHQKFYCIITPLNDAALRYSQKLSVEPTSKTTTIAYLSVQDNLWERGEDFLVHLTELYNKNATIDFNLEAQHTADFINKRLGAITDELTETESKLESYKQNNNITDYKLNVQAASTQSVQYDANIVDVETQINLVTFLLDFASDPDNKGTIFPSNIGLADPTLSKTLTEYNDLVVKRNKMLRSANADNPSVVQLTGVIDDQYGAIRGSLIALRNELNIKLKKLNSKMGEFQSSLTKSPSTERGLAEIGRQQQVKANLYIMLLQKREENLIQLASTVNKAKAIEAPMCRGYISPISRNIYLIALALGFLIPIVLIYLIKFLQFRVKTEEDITMLSDVTVFSSIPHIDALAKSKRTIVLQENRNSLVMEVYRMFRSALPFVLKPDEKVILFTSTTSGEGKTCIASNLSASIAFAGKKVVIVGLDIRKPKLANLFDLDDSMPGISDFLTRNSDDYKYLDSLLQQTTISKNLYILPAGTIPPNPTELLSRDNLKYAIEHLKENFDFIILDTAPIGLVSDTLTMTKLADVSFYVVRSNYTLKSGLNLLNSLAKADMINNPNIILNDVKVRKEDKFVTRYGGGGQYGYGYGHSYGYGYGTGYGTGYGVGYGDGKDGKLDEV